MTGHVPEGQDRRILDGAAARLILDRLGEALAEPRHGDDEPCNCPPFPVITERVRDAFAANLVLTVGGPARFAMSTDLNPRDTVSVLRAVADHIVETQGLT